MSEKNTLQRSITLPLLTLYAIGNILGAGIYVLIGKVTHYAGIYTPLSFIVAAIIVLFTAFSYMEMSARYPKSAGGALYVYEGFHKQWLANLIGFIIMFSGIFSAATILKGFYGYLEVFVNLDEQSVYLITIAVLTFIAIIGISHSVKVAVLLTLIEVSGLLLVIFSGWKFVDAPLVIRSFDLFSIDMQSFYMIILGAFLAFYAYIGFEDIVNLAEEVKAPQKNIPRAVIIAVLFSTLLYILIAIVSIAVLGVEQLSTQNAPLAAVYEKATHTDAGILRIIGMLAVINGALIQIIMVSRLIYGMSKERWLPAFLSYLHPKTHTPVVSTLITAAVIIVLVLFFPIETLAKATSSLIFILFIAVNASLIRVKQRDPHPKGVKIYPLWIPATAIVLNSAMLIFQLYQEIMQAAH